METRSAPPLIGGRYRIDGLLGEGGMARVFDAFDERLERPVAVKILRAEAEAVPGMRQRFQQEALLAARLIHPHIVAVLDFGDDHASSYLVMERLPGTTLRDEIVARGPVPLPRVMLVMGETLTALAAAHRFGVLHRDIKPSNILLEQDGHTKITDFGIAKSLDVRTDPCGLTDELTMSGVVLGTPGYLAPERRSGRPATVQSDLYSVGAVLVETATGQRLGPDAVQTERLPPLLRDVARRALAPDPRDRFTSAAEMLQTLRLGPHGARPRPHVSAPTVEAPVRPRVPLPGTAVLPPPRSPQPWGTRSRVRRRRSLAVAAALAALSFVAALFVLLENGSQPTGRAASASKHHAAPPRTQAVTQPTTQPTDAEGAAIRALATSLAGDALPGDAALADALDATAAQPPGPDRQFSAQQVLSLAGVLVDGGGITSGQYEDIVNVLQPTGATPPTTPDTAPSPSPLVPFLAGGGHGHGRGDGEGGHG